MSQVIPLTDMDVFDFEQIGEPEVQCPKSCVHFFSGIHKRATYHCIKNKNDPITNPTHHLGSE
jgi:hypothetical protein